jgi:hypothetical protein
MTNLKKLWQHVAPAQVLADPDFICFGAQKGGTRWLYDQMNSRRDVWMTPVKELNYFTKTALSANNLSILEASKVKGGPMYRRKGDAQRIEAFRTHFLTYTHDSDIDWYRTMFAGKLDRKSGDISPNYETIDDDALEFLSRSLAATKFIYLVRDPIDRLWSALCHSLRKQRVSEQDITNWATLREVLERRNVQRHSNPALAWTRWTAALGAHRMRYYLFDDIIAEPQSVVDDVCGFIGLAPGPGGLAANFNRKSSNAKVTMPPEIRLRLSEHMAPEYERCAKVFGGHAVRWRDKNLDRLDSK